MQSVPYLSASFASEHPEVTIDETETTSIEILRKLAAYELDAGITYVNNEPLEHVRALPIYDEQYVAVIPESSPFAGLESVTWEQLASVPLCLMHRDMQNRRIYDAAFASVGCVPDVRIEVYSMLAKLAYLQAGNIGTIMPSTLLPWLRVPGMHTASIVQPTVSKAVGLVIADRSPLPSLVEAFWHHVEGVIPTLGHLPGPGQSTVAIAP
jgi:DNA-binding transcriptional LysR family regulator